ncbi:MAG: hypothetical protein K2X29_03780 [Candidatus Obscuribacterales bacterium]|nr:hypothetical protein [Candidatus Obscuribacterales bacterium]
MASNICKVLGIAFLIIGFIGCFEPGIARTHLSPLHNIIHMVSGLVAMWFGFKGSVNATKNFCMVFGALYGLLGLVGLFAPPGMPSMHGMVYSSHLLRVIPGVLELGTNDHVLHIFVGALFLFGGFSTPKVDYITPTPSDRTKEEVSMR